MNVALLPWQHLIWQSLSRQLFDKRLPHALLFLGAEGIGKYHFAEFFAKAMLCDQNNEKGACGICRSCVLFSAGSHPDYLAVLPENKGQAIRIDAIRQLIEFVYQTALRAHCRVILIQPAIALNQNAANALLKVLEEPPPQTFFILVNNLNTRLLPTLTSRCQKVIFPLPESALALAWLEKQCPDKDCQILLNAAEGSPLTALNWVTEGIFSLQQDFYQDWQHALKGQISFTEFSTKWAAKPIQEKVPVTRLLDWLFYWLRDFARAQLTSRLSSLDWIDFYTKLMQVAKDIATVPQLNRQLLLEDLLSYATHRFALSS